ncbi:hypothetical protein JCM8547_005220 [Rhodosporidiobolus lusitaniae]
MTTRPSSEHPLFPHSNLPPLIALLAPHLPHTLPVYSILQTPGFDVPVYASFSPEQAGDLDETKPFFILADLGSQLRSFCSYETKTALTDEEKIAAEDLIVGAFKWYLREHRNGRDVVRIGAIPDIWTGAIARSFSKPFYPSNIHYQPLSSSSAASSDATSPDFEVPEGLIAGLVEERHIEQILSTSDVPHPPSYILTRLLHNSALFSTPSSSTTLSSTPSSDPGSSSSSSPPASPELIGHCITHRDGSIGTLFVSPSHRQHGLGSLILRHRMSAMALPSYPAVNVEGAERFAFCYVSPKNEGSRKLMKNIGMKETEWCVSWAVVELPLQDWS